MLIKKISENYNSLFKQTILNRQGPLPMEIAAKCNPCLSSPCLYDSKCLPHPTEVYKCVCKPGFKGRNCQLPIDPCILNPCENNGVCHARSEKIFELVLKFLMSILNKRKLILRLSLKLQKKLIKFLLMVNIL